MSLKSITKLILGLMFACQVLADTPPARVINSETYDAAGNAITSTVTGPHNGLDVNILNATSSTVNQGNAGSQSWLVHETGTVPVTGTFFQAVQPVSQSGTWSVLAVQSGAWSTGRTWTLSSGTDSVNVGNFPSTFGVTQSTSPWIVSGTVTSNIGTTNGLALDATVANVQGSSTGGTAAAKSSLSGGIFNSVAPTLTNGQQAGLQLDVNGNLKITPAGGSTSVTQGTSPWVVGQSSGANLHADIDNFPATTAVTQSTSPWVVSGTVTSNQGGAPWTVRQSDGTLSLSKLFDLDTSGSTHEYNLGTSIRLPASGGSVAGGTSSNPLRIDPTGSTTQPVSGSLGRTWNLSSGSDSVSATQGTSPWLTSRNWTLSSGTDSVNVGNFPATQAVTQSTSPWVVSGTITANAGTGTFLVDGSAHTQPVSGTVTANAGTGNFTVVQPTGTNLHAVLDTTSTTAVTQATAANLNATVVGAVTANAGTNLNTSALALSANQTNGTQTTRVTDGTNTAAVKAASTAAVATDPALVVAISPNNTPVLPSGASTSANQTTANTTLSTIATNTTGLSTSANQINGTQKTQIVDGDGDVANVFSGNELQVQTESKQTFLDSFDAGLDTVNRWNTPVAAGGGVSCSTATPGDTACGTGTTANGYSYVTTQNKFRPSSPGWVESQTAVNLEFPITLNTYRFWGLANPQAVPTAANPISDGCGFEVATSGKMFAVCYSSGTRNVIQDLSSSTGNSKQPTDSSVHKYFLFFRGDLSYWFIDTTENLVATMATGAPGPIVNTLPYALIAVAGSSAPGSSGVLTDNATWIGDTSGAQGNNIADGTYPWRNAQVSAIGAVSIGNSFTNATGTSSALNATPIPATDVSQYQCLKFQVTGTSTQTITMQGSGDNSTWVSNSFKDTSVVTAAAQSTVVNTAGESTFYMPINVRYIRLISTAYTSGTMTVPYQLSTLPCSFDIGTHAVGTTAVTLAAGILTSQASTTDIASAARTTTFTSASINQAQGSMSGSAAISVTAVSGTNPTMDCVLQESNDTGTTFYDSYHWERITATGVYQSPVMRWNGNRIRYVCTIAGTTPSFTFSGIRVDAQNGAAYRKRFFDRTLAPNSINSTTASWYTEGCSAYNFTTTIAACTTFPTIALQLSEDNSNWGTTTDSVGVTANGTSISSSVNYQSKFARLIVTTPGTTCTNTYMAVSCSGN